MRKLRTYLVEDSAVIREDLTATLQELAPVEVVGFASGEHEALRWLTSTAVAVDLIILDIILSAGSGVGVLRRMAESDPPRVVVVLSNYVTPELRDRCLGLGAVRVFDKSIDIEALMAYCTALSARRPEAPLPRSHAI